MRELNKNIDQITLSALTKFPAATKGRRFNPDFSGPDCREAHVRGSQGVHGLGGRLQ